MPGIALTRLDVDARAGSIAQTLNQTFERVKDMQAWLAAQTDVVLQAPPYNYTANDVAVLKTAFLDLDQLRTIYEGTANLTNAKNFRTFAQQIWGLGFA